MNPSRPSTRARRTYLRTIPCSPPIEQHFRIRVELTAFPQNGPPPHIHLREDESFLVLDGEFSVLLGERTLTAGQGAFVHIPKGTLHTYKNIGSTPGRIIILLTPGGFERLWEELGEPATQLTTPPPVDAGVIEKLIALAPNYHLQIPPPPR